MPIYDYECPEHGEFEIIMSMNDESIVTCPECDVVSKKLVSIFAINWRETPMGTTRGELFDNLAKDDNGGKDWRDYDSYYHRTTGNLDALDA